MFWWITMMQVRDRFRYISSGRMEPTFTCSCTLELAASPCTLLSVPMGRKLRLRPTMQECQLSPSLIHTHTNHMVPFLSSMLMGLGLQGWRTMPMKMGLPHGDVLLCQNPISPRKGIKLLAILMMCGSWTTPRQRKSVLAYVNEGGTWICYLLLISLVAFSRCEWSKSYLVGWLLEEYFK